MRYTKDHEWMVSRDGEVVVGITEFAANQLGDIVFIELPEEGATIEAGAEIAVVESVKAASDILAPASGVVTAVNDAIISNPGLVNEDPLGEGWFFRMEFDDSGEFDTFLGKEEYQLLTQE